MYYYSQVDTPYLTPESDPVITTVKLGEGLLEFVDIGIPSWVNRLCKCRIYYNSIQLLPWNRDQWFTGNDITVRVPIDLQLTDDPFEITIQQYNEDDTFSHQLSYGFSMNYGAKLDIVTLANLTGLVQLPPEVK